jgi:hypothetical protein
LSAYSVAKLRGRILLENAKALESLKFEGAEGIRDFRGYLVSVDRSAPGRSFKADFQPEFNLPGNFSVRRKLVFSTE